MKKITTIVTICFFPFLFFFVSKVSYGQINLAPNPSFEVYDTCPDNLSQISRATEWYSSRVTPDYINSCAAQSSGVSEPSNFAGYHTPSSGNAYGGIYAGIAATNAREYIGAELITPLQVGTRYYVSFKVSLAQSYHFFNWCGLNKLGVLFSTVQFNSANIAPICNCAQMVSDSIITDTLNWIRIKGSFIADSVYSFISIGRFAYDSSTNYIQLGIGTQCNAYYFVDDVCISNDSSYAYNYIYTGINELSIKETIDFFPNPARDWIEIRGNGIQTLTLCDVLGRIVYITNSDIISPNIINTSTLPRGMYFLSAKTQSETISKKMILD